MPIVSSFTITMKSPVLIVNNEKLNILKNEGALDLLINRILQFKGQREFFNPNFD